jgi:hypothetical protein
MKPFVLQDVSPFHHGGLCLRRTTAAQPATCGASPRGGRGRAGPCRQTPRGTRPCTPRRSPQAGPPGPRMGHWGQRAEPGAPGQEPAMVWGPKGRAAWPPVAPEGGGERRGAEGQRDGGWASRATRPGLGKAGLLPTRHEPPARASASRAGARVWAMPPSRPGGGVVRGPGRGMLRASGWGGVLHASSRGTRGCRYGCRRCSTCERSAVPQTRNQLMLFPQKR